MWLGVVSLNTVLTIDIQRMDEIRESLTVLPFLVGLCDTDIERCQWISTHIHLRNSSGAFL